MRKRTTTMVRNGLAVAAVLTLPAIASAQDDPGGDTGGNVTIVQVPGAPPPAAAESAPGVNDHLSSSSRTSSDTSRSADGFDFSRASGGEAHIVRGNASGAYVVSGERVPEMHTAKRGDTLWDISAKYFGNAYNWPRVWSYNKQIQNPHWIYPGDHIRLRGGYGVSMSDSVRPGGLVPPTTVFQRHHGYVLDGKHPVWGEIIGSPDDQMLLSENDEIYIKLEDDKKDLVEVGQVLTLFEPREVKNLTPHPLVWIRGVAVINRVNRKARMVRARILESLDVVERGVKVGPADRKIDAVKPVRNKRTIQAQIVGALYPYEFYGQGQVVFIDKGKDDGVEVGNRFFAVSRGDEWRLGLRTAGQMADDRAITEDDRMARVEQTPDKDEPKLYPAETYAEVIVLRVREKTSTCMVTASIREIARGALIIARKGY